MKLVGLEAGELCRLVFSFTILHGRGLRGKSAESHRITTTSMRRSRPLRLLGEIHAAEDGLEAGVGAEGVEHTPFVNEGQRREVTLNETQVDCEHHSPAYRCRSVTLVGAGG